MSDPFALHNAVLDEIRGLDTAARIQDLLENGADPHGADSNGDTPFNVAAASAPASGRLMTLHWLKLALEGKGEKGLNDISGSHGSTLAQYIAKWLNDDEIEQVVSDAVARGLRVDVPNDSGWTPLIAAAAMGRVGAVKAFIGIYSRDSLYAQTAKPYTALYDGCTVRYERGLNALEIAGQRAVQDESASEEMGERLWACMELLAEAFDKARPADKS